MKAYQILAGAGHTGLKPVERTSREPDADEFRVGIAAAALNNRGLSFARGQFHNPPSHPLIPLVDRCGEVVAVGSSVTGSSSSLITAPTIIRCAAPEGQLVGGNDKFVGHGSLQQYKKRRYALPRDSEGGRLPLRQ